MEILAGVVTTGATTSPLKNDGEVGVSGGNIDNLANAVDRTWLERDVLDTSVLETLDDLCCLLRARDTSGNTETFNRKAFATHLLPEGELEAELTRVDVQRVEGDANASWNLALDFSNLSTESLGVIVTTSGQLDMKTSVQDRADETSLDSSGGHTSDHNWRLAKEAGERSVNVEGTIAETRLLVSTI